MDIVVTRLTGPYANKMYLVSGSKWSTGRMFVLPIDRPDLIKGFMAHKVTFILLCEGEVTGLMKPKSVVYRYAAPITPHQSQDNNAIVDQLINIVETSNTLLTEQLIRRLCG